MVTPVCNSNMPMAVCASKSQSVQWTDQTALIGITVETLSGAVVKVEGYLNDAGVVVAREIRKPEPTALDAYDKPASPATPTNPAMPTMGWEKYRNQPKPDKQK